MANPSVTYTFSNGTAADAAQVNQNFTDVLNSLSDGTKDLTIASITASGTIDFSGSVTLGNSSVDDVSILGSLAASLPVKTNALFDIGSSTLGLAGIYFGATGPFTTRVITGATANWTFTLPVTAGTNRYILETNGSGVSAWVPIRRSADVADNISVAAAVGTNALTITLNAANGSAPSSSNPSVIVFRSATITNGTPVERAVTGALTMTVSSGSTLGHLANNAMSIYVYALDNSGTVELAVSSARFDEALLYTTTAEGGAGAADSSSVLYSTTARTGVAIRLIAKLTSNQSTAGTWAAVPTRIALAPFQNTICAMLVFETGTPTGAFDGTGNAVYNDLSYDTHGGMNTSTGAYIIKETGYYSIKGSAIINAAPVAGNRTILQIFANGVAFANSVLRHTSTGVFDYSVQVSIDAAFTAGENVALRINTNAASPAWVSDAQTNYFAVHKIAGVIP